MNVVKSQLKKKKLCKSQVKQGCLTYFNFKNLLVVQASMLVCLKNTFS